MRRTDIRELTRDALAVKRANGVRLGRPPAMPTALRQRLRAMRGDGMTYRAIASVLEREGVPTAHGGERWHASTVARAIRCEDAAA